MEIRFFNKITEDFISSLEPRTIAKVLRTIDLLERFGCKLGMPHSKRVRDDIFELRIRGDQEVRLLYVFFHGGIVILHGFVKKSDRIPARELRVAMRRRNQLDTI